MKNLFFKAFLAFVTVFATSAAFAQCGGMNLKFLDRAGQFHCSSEAAQAADRTRAERFSGTTVGVIGVQAAPVFVQQPVVLQALPAGYVYRDCTPGEVLKRDSLMMFRGLVAGALVGDNSRSAGVGAGAGLFYSMTGDCRVAVPQGATTTLGNQGRVGHCPHPRHQIGILNKPGDSKHGQEVCAFPGDQYVKFN